MRGIVTGAVVAQALLALTAAEARPMFSFTTEVGAASALRISGNRWLLETGHGHMRFQVYRVHPYTSTTYAKVEWEARLVKRGTHD